jgi:hypothetical protein
MHSLLSRRLRRGAALSSLVVVLAGTVSAAGLPVPVQEQLRESDLIYTATRRTDGTTSEYAPIWFWYDGETLYFTTSPESWKARRLAKGSPLYIRVGKEDGPSLVGTAERITDPAMVDRMGKAYDEKYWIAWLGFFRPRAERVTEGKTIAYRVSLREGGPP